ncbi:MAG: hypothetical protein IH988_08180 [Planctomycetes bacterium]|nr:hypothetical protein [Planctomycetota bacterium]
MVNSLDDPGDPDDGLTTLREAIDEAHDVGGGSITFDPSLAGGTIRPLSQLPIINADNGITIDGDLDNDGVPDIELDGSLAGKAIGLSVHSANNTIKGLAINRFRYPGVKLFGKSATDNLIEHCYIGTDLSGSIALPNEQ